MSIIFFPGTTRSVIRLCMIITFSIMTIKISCQNVLRGLVADGSTNLPVEGAIVRDLSSNHLVLTNALGQFQIKSKSDSILIQMFGFEDKRVRTATDSFMVVYLKTINYTFDKPIQINSSAQFRSLSNFEILNRKQIDLGDQLNIHQSLNTIPGIYMHSGALNTNRITIRGVGSRSPFSTTKIRAYLDEIPITSGIGETTIEDLDFDIIEKTEVFKGPTASRYGAGLGGLILLYTKPVEIARNHFSVKSTVGAYGLLDISQKIQLKTNENLRVQLAHRNVHRDGYRENNQFDRRNLNALFSFTNNQNGINVLANHVKLKAFIPSSLNFNDFINTPQKAAFSWANAMGFEDYEKTNLGFSFQRQWKPEIYSSVSIFQTSRNSYELRPFNILQEQSNSIGVRMKISYEQPSIQPLAVQAGVEIFRELYDWQTLSVVDRAPVDLLSNNHEIRKYYNLFLESSYDFNSKWKAEMGINLNSTNYDLEDRFAADSIDFSGSYSFNPIISPRLSIGYIHENNQTYYFTISHGFSAPTLEETLTPDGLINPEIQPEKGWNLEIGNKARVHERFSYDISIYSMWIFDLLVARRTDFDQFTGINAGKTRHSGIEIQTKWDLRNEENSIIQWINSGHFTHYRFLDFIDEGNDYSGNILTGTPSQSIHSILHFSQSFFYGNVHFQYVDEMPVNDANSIYSESYSLVNAKIGLRKNLEDRFHFDIYLGLNNFFDTHYASMLQINAASFGGSEPRYYYPGLPRHLFGGAKLRFEF